MFKTSRKRREYDRRKNERIKAQTFSHYCGGLPKCQSCGETDIKVLCIDHINGGGTKERRERGHRGGIQTYYWLRKMNYPDGYQVLCANCNLRKEILEDLHLAGNVSNTARIPSRDRQLELL